MKRKRAGLVLILSTAVIFCGLVRGGPIGGSYYKDMAEIKRSIPEPFPNHPGNIFVEAENIEIPNVADGISWKVIDYDNNETVKGQVAGEKISIGKLPVGHYRLLILDDKSEVISQTTVGVLKKLAAPTPQDSPICVHAAITWEYAKQSAERTKPVANLIALAGINWVRDNSGWSDFEPQRGVFPSNTPYHRVGKELTDQGVKDLMMLDEYTAFWALTPEQQKTAGGYGHPFPNDLRDVYNFMKGAGQSCQGKILAWEPRNEPFQRRTSAAVAAFQKAAYLGLKAGSPETIGSLCSWDGQRDYYQDQIDNSVENEILPYCDVYNIHIYAPSIHDWSKRISAFRKIAGGRPIWLTECGIKLPVSDSNTKELSPENLQKQANFVAQSCAVAINEGVTRHFFFYLFHFESNGTQYGVLRKDLTPKPGYVALAAAGRLMAGAKPLGKIQNMPEGTAGYLFQAIPDGRKRLVALLWNWHETKQSWTLPVKSEKQTEVYDVLGRLVNLTGKTLPVSPSPVYLVMPLEEQASFKLEPAPQPVFKKIDQPCPIVLNIFFPDKAPADVRKSAYHVAVGESVTLTLQAYNFSPVQAKGTLRVIAPEGFIVKPAQTTITLAPMERKEIPVAITMTEKVLFHGVPVRIEGNFGLLGKCVIAPRFCTRYGVNTAKKTVPLQAVMGINLWQNNQSNGQMSKSITDGWLNFDCNFSNPGTENWAAPFIELSKENRIPPGASGISFRLKFVEGKSPVFVQLNEEDGAIYFGEVLYAPTTYGEESEVVLLFDTAGWGSWSKKDDNQHLDLDKVRIIRIGFTNINISRVRYSIKDLKWINY